MSKKQIKTEYMYSTPRFRFAEGKMLTRDELYSLCEAQNAYDIAEKLVSKGNAFVKNSDGGYDLDLIADKIFLDSFNFVSEVSETPHIYDIFKYPYDCHNLKSAIKCAIRGVDAMPLMYFCSSVSPEHTVEAIKNREVIKFPKNMANAALDAIDSYAKTKNPQLIDIVLDKACFADMLALAKDSRSEYLAEVVRTKIDLANILLCDRMMRMPCEHSREAIFDMAFIDGGSINRDVLTDMLSLTRRELAEKIANTEYYLLSRVLFDEKSNLAMLEKAADDTLMELALNAKRVSFGVEVAAGYIMAREMEAKNIRILINGKKNGDAAQSIRERLRVSYE